MSTGTDATPKNGSVPAASGNFQIKNSNPMRCQIVKKTRLLFFIEKEFEIARKKLLNVSKFKLFSDQVIRGTIKRITFTFYEQQLKN